MKKSNLLVLWCLLILISLSSSSAAIINQVENTVSNESNIDNSTNLGRSETTNFGNTQSFDGSNHIISEENIGGLDQYWTYQKAITIDSDLVSEDQQDFPVYIELYDADLKQVAQSDGDDIIFTSAQGKPLPYQYEIYDYSFNSTHVHLVAWIQADLKAHADTTIYMKYGNSQVTAQEAPEEVWDDNFVGVWHLQEDPTGTAPQMLDSTRNNNDGTAEGTDLPASVSGQILNGLDFTDPSENDQRVGVPSNPSLILDQYMTISTWINLDSASKWQTIVSKMSAGLADDEELYFGITNDGEIFIDLIGDNNLVGTWQTGVFPSIGTWYHVAFTYNSTSQLGSLIVNGVLEGTHTFPFATPRTNNNPLYLGYNQEWTNEILDGQMDEVQISNIPRSESWLNTQYQNQINPEAFYSVSNQEEVKKWQYAKNLYVNPSQVPTDLTNFPLLVSMYDADLKEKAQVDGQDIAFFDESEAQVPHEIETYDPNFNATHAELVAWVKSDLFADRQTRITMRYGNLTTMVNQQNPVAVWDKTYQNVWHLNNDPSSISPQITDSSTLNDGTTYGSMTTDDTTTGQVGSALDFDGIDDVIDVNDINSDSWTGLTLSGWIYKRDTGYDTIFSVSDTTSSSDSVFSLLARDNFFRARIGTDGTGGGLSTNYDTPAGTFVTNQWQFISMTWNAATNTLRIYVNGQLELSTTVSGDTIIDDTAININGLTATIGNINLADSRYYNGLIDELRLASSSRSQDFITAEYNNQNNPASFYSVGSEIFLKQEFAVDFADTDIDNSQDHLGTQSNFYDQKVADGVYNSWSGVSSVENTHSIFSDGTAYVRIGDGNVGWNTERGTISFWMNFDYTGGNIQRLWGLNKDMEIRTVSGEITLDWGGTGSLSTSGSVIGTTNKWYFIAVSWDQVDDTLTLYVGDENNVPTIVANTASWTASVTSLEVTENNFMASSGGSAPIQGNGEQLRFYDIDRSLATIQSDYNVSLFEAGANLRSYFRFDNSYTDEGVDGNHGTPVSGLSFSTTHANLSIISSFNQEFQWLGLPYQSLAGFLNIKTGSLSSGDLQIDYWDGNSWVNLISGLLAYSWNNISLSGILAERQFTIRISSTELHSPGTSDLWEIDVMIIEVFNYRQDWEYQIQGVELNQEFYKLAVFAGTSDAEPFTLQIWNSTSSTWYTPLGSSINNSQWYNISLTQPELITSTITIRFSDSLTTADDTLSSLNIDYVAVISHIDTPELTISPGDIQYNEGEISNTLTWRATDDNPATFELFKDTILIDSGSWSSGGDKTFNIDNLVRGVYNFTISFTDQFGGVTTDTSYVTVIDNLLPEITQPADLLIDDSSSNNNITWTLTDLHPDTYVIYENLTLVETNNWVNGSIISYNLDHLTEGTYNITIQIFDDSGNSKSDTVMVVVSDLTPPAITTILDMTVEDGSAGNWINWTIVDAHPSTYTIYQNGTIVDTGGWITGVNYSIDGLTYGTYNITLVVFDETGNFNSDTVIVTVVDTTPPNLSGPADFTYVEGTSGNSIIWSVSDLYPKNFTIYRDGAEFFSFGLSSDTLKLNIDGLLIGSYNYTIVVEDIFGNQASDSVIVTVVDETLPTITSPNDVIYSLGETGNQLQWIGTDTHAGTYSLEKDGIEIASGSWISGAPITFNIDGLSDGTYNYTIILLDTSGNRITDEVTVEVTQQSVFTEIPEDIFYTNGTSGNQLSWTISDSDPNYYIIYQNGSIVDQGNWFSGTPITINIDGLEFGVYNYTISANDTLGNNIFDTVYVTVSDIPVWDTIPSNQITYSEGTVNYIISWNATDMFPDTYEIYQNGTLIDSGTWNNASLISWDIGGLTLGDYNFTIIVYDTLNNKLVNTVILTVEDTTNPSGAQPDNITYSEGSTGNNITWIPADSYPNYYEIYQNDTLLNETGNWQSGAGIVFDIDGLAKGRYNFTIYVYDSSGNVWVSTVNVEVIDDTPPTISHPEDVTYSEGSVANNQINWTSYDNYEGTYVIYNNGTQITSGSWTSGQNITYTLTNLSKGLYNFTIMINDTSGNIVTDTVYVNVIDTTPPSISNPSDASYSEGPSNKWVNWTVSDTYNDTYEIYLNGNLTQSGEWISGDDISYDITALTKGLYNVTIIVYDQSGNTIVDQVEITIIDNKDPVIDTTVSNAPFIEGDSTKWVNWTVSDTYSDTYEIYLNGSLELTSSWNTGVMVSYDITGLSRGTYNLTIVFYDQSGNSVIQSTWISIFDETSPVISTPPDIEYAEGSTANTIIWTGTDSHPYNYTIYQNGTIITLTQTSWTSNSQISIDIDGLTKGAYNYTIYLFDESGNWISDTVIVTVIDETVPQISSENDITYLEGETGNTINWSVSDTYLSRYEIYNNTILYQYGNWSGTSAEILIVDIDGLLIGEYTFVIKVWDESGNFATDTVIVQVIETTPPEITKIPTDFTYSEGNSSVIVNWTATDSYADTYEILLDGVSVHQGSWTSGIENTYNISQLLLPKGTYTFTLVIYDSSMNFNSTSFEVTVEDITPPSVTGSEDLSYGTGSSGNTISWVASDKYSFSYSIYRNDQLIRVAQGTNGEQIIINVDNLGFGENNFTIVVTDASGNSITDSIFVSVTDGEAPVLVNDSGDLQLIEGATLGETIWWEFSDDFPSEYNITRNGFSVSPNTLWQNERNLTLTLSELSRGTYDFTIYVWDSAGNIQIHTIRVTILDGTDPEFLSSPNNNLQMIEGSSGNVLSWTMFDEYEYRYHIYVNNQIVVNATWLSNSAIQYNIDALVRGMNNVTIVVLDQSGNTNIQIISIEVLDTTFPIFVEQPSNLAYVEGVTGNELSWRVGDLHPSIYNITRNGELLLNDTWESNTEVVINVDGLSFGNYNFTIYFLDDSGNTITDFVIVEVLDVIAPQLNGSPSNFTMIEGSSGNKLVYDVYDLYPNSYIFYVDGVIVESKLWTNNQPIVISIDEYSEGNYNFSIEIFDQAQNSVSHNVLIRVKDPGTTDTLEPIFEVETDVYGGDLEYINGTWLTVDGEPVVSGTITVRITSSNTDNTYSFTTLSDGYYEIILNYTGFSPGSYAVFIDFQKDGYQSWGQYRYNVQIHPHSYSIRIDVSDTLIQGEEYYISAIVTYNNPTQTDGLSLNGQLIPIRGPAGGIEVTFIIQVYYASGSYTGITKTAFTTPNGLALISLSASETLGLVRFESISASIEGGATSNAASASFDSSKFPDIQAGDPPLFDVLVIRVEEYLNYILIAVAFLVFITFALIKRNQRIKARIKTINDSISYAHEELNAILSIQSIIIQTSNSVNVYTEDIVEDAVNSFLLGGMVNAFSSFLDEIAKGEMFQFEIMKRGNVSVTSHKGKYSNFIIISREKIPFNVLTQVQNLHIDLESDLDKYFKSSARGSAMLKTAKVHPYFEKHQFKVSLTRKLKINTGNIRSLINQEFISRILKQNFMNLNQFLESEYYSDDGFYVQDLLEFLKNKRLSQQVCSRIVILGYIYDIISPSN